jgi:2,3-diketo-5-methylthio-1-phosphopentane phosphatase
MKIKNNNSIHIFCDFDGTITYKDLGDELFKELGKFQPHNFRLMKTDIDIKQYWTILCTTLIHGTSQKIIAEWSGKFDIDPYFKPFVEYCRNINISLNIVSDGFVQYIKPILKRLELDYLPVYCNDMLFAETITPVFTGASESCTCLCASCKRNAVINNVPEDGIIVYIGDGNSDFCVAEHSDIIFAKKSLAAYCNANKIPHYPFKNFFDIKRIFENQIIFQNKFKPRRQAELKRIKAFEIE